jgi:hypothetical protein
MLSFFTRPGRASVALAAAALTACVDTPNPTEVRVPDAPNRAIGDVIVVTNTNGANVAGSIRQVLSQTTGGEIIRFDQSLAGAKIVLDTTLEVPKNVTIEGPATRGITLSGANRAGVMHVHEGARLVNLTITEGNAEIVGGGIVAEGALVLDHTTVTGNEAGSVGGIFGETITLTNSTVTSNSARVAITQGVAGGISFDFAGAVTLTNSTVSHNTPAGLTGHGNSSNRRKVLFENAIVSNNGTQNCIAALDFTFAGRNISDDDSCGGNALEMLVADPLLGPLADNGGPTPTRALDRHSPAIDATDCPALTVDQRYVARDAKCDIGAFEFVPTSVTLAIISAAQVDPKTGVAVVTGRVSCSRAETFDLVVALTQDQRAKRIPTVVRATKTLPIACGTTTQPWIALIAPASGQAFENGTALATVETANTDAGVTAATTSTTVKLAWTKAR